jgi:COP9 signalosome complex subunit 7
MSENQYIEQFMILAKNQKSKALETIIEQVLSHANIFVFGEFLNLPNVQDVSTPPKLISFILIIIFLFQMGQESKHYRTLSLFAFETYLQYKQNLTSFLELKPQQIKKLKMITIADIASKSKNLEYVTLMKALDIQDLRELEDLIIDCIYNELLKGQLDQKNQQLHVEHTYGRDVRQQDIEQMLQKLEQWDVQLEGAQTIVERQIRGCNESVIDTYNS